MEVKPTWIDLASLKQYRDHTKIIKILESRIVELEKEKNLLNPSETTIYWIKKIALEERIQELNLMINRINNR
jgi:hypothetical protein